MSRSSSVFVAVIAVCFVQLVLTAPSSDATNGAKNGVEEKPWRDCNETHTIAFSNIDTLFDTGSFPDETQEAPKCYITCIMEQLGMLSEDGSFNPHQAAVTLLSDNEGKVTKENEEAAKTCAAETKEAPKCEKSYQFYKCVLATKIKQGL